MVFPLDIYRLFIEIFLVVFSAGLWWLLRRIVADLAEDVELDLTPTLIPRRAVAVWVVAWALVIIPIGAALSPTWRQIQEVLLAGR